MSPEDSIQQPRQKPQGVMNTRLMQPWTEQQDPFRILENIYFVGTKWVSVFLIDTPEGLILIDSSYKQVFYLVLDNIYRLGFDPRRIRLLLLTHGHWDHCGGAKQLQEISGCEIWLGKEDAYFFTERRNLIGREAEVGDFRIDHFYDDQTPIRFGGMTIRTVHTPGHTPGTTSFFFDVAHEGSTLRFGLHGGLGTNGLSRPELKEHGWPLSFQQGFVDMLHRMKEIPVDVTLPSHAGMLDFEFFRRAARDDSSGQVFIDPTDWPRLMDLRLAAMQKILDREQDA